MGKPRRPSDASSSHVGYLFNFLLLANFIQYMEAGAVPALLVIIAKSFEMDSGEQGLLGGVVYLSLGIGGPFAGYLLRRYEHKRVIVLAVALNMVFTVLWAMTPIHHTYSTTYYIIMRFMMGLCQCIICVYLPLWTSENAPRDKRTIWMSYLQASVPLGVMMGYIVASIFMNFAQSSVTCGSILCWRWPFLIEIILLSPLYLALYFVPVEYMALSVHARGKRNPISRVSSKNQINDDPTILKSIPSEDSGHVPLPDFTPSESEANNINTKNSNNSTNSTSKVYSKDITSKPQQLGADLGERRRRLALRRHSMTASMFDPLYSRDVVRRSIDDLSLYDSSDSLLDLFAGFTSAWSGNGTGTGGNGSRRSSSISPADQPQDSMFLAFDGTEDDFNYNNSQRRPPVRSLPNQRQSYPLYMPSNHMNLPHHHHHPQQQQQQHQPIAGLYGSIGGLGSSSNNNGNGSSNYSSANNSNRNSIQLQHPITLPDSNNNSDSLKYESLRDIHKKTLYDNLIPGRKRTLSNSQSSSPMIAIAASNSSMQPPLQSQHISSNGEVKDSTDHIVVVVDSPPSDQYHYYHSPTADELQNTESSMIYNSDDEEDGDEDDDDGSESEEEWISPVKAPRPPTHNTHAIANGLTSTTTEEGQQLLLNGNNPNHNNNSSNSSYYRRNSLNGHGERKLTWVRTLRRLLSLSIYRNILGAMTCLYFTVTGVQFWGTKYLTVSLNAPLMLVNTLFVLCAATGPTFGVFFGGWIIDLLGGYNGRKKRCSTLYICCILGVLGFLCSIPITFCTSIFSAIIFLWLALFFGAATLPASSGILVSIVPREMRPFSSSVSMMVFNMCGYFASLILSGYLMQMLEARPEICGPVCAMTWGFRLILFWSFFSVVFVLSAYRTARAQVDGMERRRSIRQNIEMDALPTRIGEVL